MICPSHEKTRRFIDKPPRFEKITQARFKSLHSRKIQHCQNKQHFLAALSALSLLKHQKDKSEQKQIVVLQMPGIKQGCGKYSFICRSFGATRMLCGGVDGLGNVVAQILGLNLIRFSGILTGQDRTVSAPSARSPWASFCGDRSFSRRWRRANYKCRPSVIGRKRRSHLAFRIASCVHYSAPFPPISPSMSASFSILSIFISPSAV